MSIQQPQLIGESAQFHHLLDRVSNLAALEQPILVVGESGTGKSLLASRLHFLSSRWERAYQIVDCAAFREEQLEEELFGRIAPVGYSDRDGRLIGVNGGTLCLNHIESLPIKLQAKLLRVLKDGQFEAVGGEETYDVDVRLIGLSSKDLPTCVKNGTFLSDLLDFMAFEVIFIPPLRDRSEDIAPLASYFGRKMISSLGAERFPGFTPEAMTFLQNQIWPGNVRELKTVVERSVANAFLENEALDVPFHNIRLNPFDEGGTLKPAKVAGDDLSGSGHELSSPVPLETTNFSQRVLAFERSLIDQALNIHAHHQGKAAKYLELSYHQFRGLLRKHGLKK